MHEIRATDAVEASHSLRAYWVFLAGFAMLAARVVLPLGLSVVLGNAFICLGMAVYAQALYLMLLSAPAPRWLMDVQPLVWLALLLMLDWPLNRRTAVLSGVYILLLAPSVWVIARVGWRAERSLRTVALSISAAMLAHAIRAVHPGATVSADSLYGQADQALYEAKRAGRNRVEAYGATVGASGLLPLQ